MSFSGNEESDIIGRWSEEKLDLLAQYIKAYSKIMNSQKETWLRSYYYVDAFAGSVRPRAKEDERRYIDGSPLRALQVEPQFDAYWFIDISQQRIERMERLRERFSDRQIEIRRGDCNRVLCQEFISQVQYASRKRAFVFLDPYGLQVNWETIRELASTRTCDIFVNFSVMGVTRLLPRDNYPGLEVEEQLSQFMGGTDWISQIYRPREQLSFLPDPALSRETLKAEWLADLYRQKMYSLFQYVSRPILMRNSTNSALYALFLASHNQTAIKIIDSISKRHEQLRVLGS